MRSQVRVILYIALYIILIRLKAFLLNLGLRKVQIRQVCALLDPLQREIVEDVVVLKIARQGDNLQVGANVQDGGTLARQEGVGVSGPSAQS